MKNQQSGFTLVELIMVIVVLGILAAFALPRFANFGGDARAAAIEGAAGAIRSASAIAHSASLAKGNNPATVDLEGAAIAMVNGYPQALASTTDGILAAAQISAGAEGADNIDFVWVASAAGASAGSSIVLQANGATTSSECQVTYATSATAGTAPTVTVDTTDC